MDEDPESPNLTASSHYKTEFECFIRNGVSGAFGKSPEDVFSPHF